MTTGIDIVEISRIEKILIKRKDQFYHRIFTDNEVLYMRNKDDNPRTVAGIFASKEAIAKALGSGIGKLAWKDIEILHDKNGKPRVNINEQTKKQLGNLGLDSIEISISHEREYAVATAICFLNSRF